MSASSQPPRPRTTAAARRTAIRDRQHAQEVAQGVLLGNTPLGGGSVQGFADWLFVNRQTFNGANPMYQVSVYVNGYRRAAARGVDFDLVCRQRADMKDKAREQVRTDFDACLAAIKSHWSETPFGAAVTWPIVELGLGRWYCLSAAPQLAAAEQDHVPSWILEWILQLFERSGGPDESLCEFETTQEFWEAAFERGADARDALLQGVAERLLQGQPPTESGFVSLASCVQVLSRLSRLRSALRVLLTQAQMIERIEAVAPSNDGNRARGRRRREV
jgi:hypothetical protein